MPDKPRDADRIGEEALKALRRMLSDDEASDSSRVAAAKTLLERYLPVEDDETRRREAEERDAAIADARCLLAELALAKLAGAGEPSALAEDGAAAAADSAG